MLPADILIVYNRNVWIDKHVCQLIYSITCFPIVKTISWRRNGDFTNFVYLFDLFFKFQDLTWLQLYSNPEPLSSYTNTQPFGQTGGRLKVHLVEGLKHC